MIPKSLHTITALVNVAQHLAFIADRAATLDVDAEMFVNRAAAVLGYAETDDVYGLKAAAVRKLEKVMQA